MSNSLLCFRTITRAGIFRQAVVSGSPVLLPIALAVPPESVSIDPGVQIEEPKELACDGRMVTSFSYEKGSDPSIDLSFSMAVAELESLIHGRIVATTPTVDGMVFAEIKSPGGTTPTAVPGRAIGQAGYDVALQTAATTKAKAYYIDPDTKLAIDVDIVDDTPTDDQIIIGARLAVTLSEALATAGHTIYIWCPCPFTDATVITAKPLGLVSVFLMGVNFDNSFRSIVARNCSRLGGGSLPSESKRSVKLRILPDPADNTGLGYQIIDTKMQVAC